MPRHSDRFCCRRCTHFDTWTLYEPLVSGTLLFGACLAGGAQENLEFSGKCLRPPVSGSHLCGVFYDPGYLTVTCSDFARGVQDYGLFWKMISTLQKTAESLQLQFIDGRRHSLRYAEADSHGPACLVDRRDYAVAVRSRVVDVPVCKSCRFQQVRRQFPVVAQRLIPMVLVTMEIPQLLFIDKVDVVCWAGPAVRAQLWETVEIPHLQPVFSLDQVVDIPVVAQMLVPLVRLP